MLPTFSLLDLLGLIVNSALSFSSFSFSAKQERPVYSTYFILSPLQRKFRAQMKYVFSYFLIHLFPSEIVIHSLTTFTYLKQKERAVSCVFSVGGHL